MGGNVDSCLYMKKKGKGLVCIDFYIDDNLMVGNIKTIDDAIIAPKENGPMLKIVEELKDSLSSEIKFSREKRGLGEDSLTSSKIWTRNVVNTLRMFEVIKS